MVGVLVVGVFTFGLTLQGATTPEQNKVDSDKLGGQATAFSQGFPVQGKLKNIDVVVDYRADDAARARLSGAGGVAFLDCALDEECNDCNPCTEDTCVEGSCVWRDYGPAEAAPDCDDGIDCNGYEYCSGGVCSPDPNPPCLISAPQVCDETSGNCVDACTTDASCDDGRYCTVVDDCVMQCEGGSDHGDPCTTPGIPGDCTVRCVETCVYTDADCGLLGVCSEGASAYGCSVGRCCDYTVTPPTCTSTTRDNCSQQWLGVDDCTQTDPPLDCPAYGSGVIDGSVVNWDYPEPTAGVVTLGPVSWLDCDHLYRIGDDYTLEIDEDYFLLEVMRFVGGVMPGWSARFSMELRDTNGNLIEDWFWPNGVNAAADQTFVGTVRFDPPLVIPKSGILSMSVMENFGPGGRIYWMSTDDPARAVNRGSNSPTTMYVNDVKTEVDFLGQCNSGDRDGLWCDRRNVDADCPGGTCVDVPDIMAFELIGDPTEEPWGACCGVGGSCFHVLPWECDAIGGKFKGQGTFCGLCTNLDDLYEPCDGDEDCSGVPDACQDQVCSQALTECETDEDCPPLETCINLTTVCGTQACCEDATGNCREALPGDDCVTGETSLGFATDCNPNCCEQPQPYSGYDNCNLAGQNARIINVPGVGATDPVVVETFTGSNAGATFDDWDDGWCERDVFDPEGDTKDPGWWEAFSLTACANVRIELCCTDIGGEPLRPAWANLYSGCPCDQILQRVGVDAPIGIGEGTDGGARGMPFCDQDDNFWQTYGPLAAGTYYYPIYSAPDGTGASPPGQVYQLNVYAAACPESQCCYLECSDTATNAGELCQYDEDCPGGFCESKCAILNVLDCDDKVGWWVPDKPGCVNGQCDAGPAMGNDCGADPDCWFCVGGDNNGEPCDELADCDVGTPPGVCDMTGVCAPPGACDTGACCTGPGTCQDEVSVGVPMNKADCHIIAADGTYWGGAVCPETVDDPDPCPICEIEDPLICSMYTNWPNVNGWVVYLSDTSVYDTMHRADDFVATNTAISDVCLWGSWIDRFDDTAARDCACGDDSGDPDCTPVVTDFFTVRVWNNDPALRKPDTLFGESTATMEGRRVELEGQTFDIWSIALHLDTSITGLSIDGIYWLEIANYTDGDPACTFYWMGDRRQYGDDYGRVENANQWHYITYNDPDWDPGDYSGLDMTWCVDAGKVPPGDSAPSGACCLCEPLGQCQYTGLGACDEAGGAWYPSETCDPNNCPSVRPVNDECTNKIVVDETHHTANRYEVGFSTVCATTDGPNPVTDENGPGTYMLKDVWFEHVATGTDFVTVDTCDAPYDGMLAVYTNGTGTCECPTSASTQYGPANDEGCGAGGGLPGSITTQFTTGICYLVRIAGFAGAATDNAEMGSGTLTITYGVSPCPYDPPAPAEADPAIPTRVKHLSFSAPGGESYLNEVRVKLTDCPAFPGSVGKSWFVGGPRDVSEIAGTSDATPPTYVTAGLEETGHPADWSLEGLVHVYGPEIAPGCTYEIALVPNTCAAYEESYSEPLVIQTAKWGDIVGGDGNQSPPQGTVDFSDISSVVDKFKNLADAPSKSRADVASGTPCTTDQIVDFVDIPAVVDAFRGFPYDDSCAP